MTIHEQIAAICRRFPGRAWGATELVSEIVAEFGSNGGSVVLSDHAYSDKSRNKYCRCVLDGAPLLHRISRGVYALN